MQGLSPTQAGAAMLDVRSVVKRFGGITVLNELSLSLRAGSINCIIGPNGCGKTTLFNVLTGVLSPEGGQVVFNGQDITRMASWRIAGLGMTRKFQIPGVYPELTVAENLIVPLAAANRRAGMMSTLFSRSGGRLAALLELCRLENKAEHKVGTLAHGEKQWLEIAMLLAVDADLILLDEPTAGMSVPETQKTAELVKRLRTDFGKTVLAIEHDMSFLRALDCHVIVMLRGRVVREGRLEDIQNDPEVIAAYLGGGHADS